MSANGNTTQSHPMHRLPAEAINTRAAWRPVLRPIGALVIGAQLALALQPLSVLAQDKGQAPYNPQAQQQMQRLGDWSQRIEQAKAQKAKDAQSPADKASERLARVQELTQSLKPQRASFAAPAARQGQWMQELREQLKDLQQDQAAVRAEFEATGAELKQKKLPPEILQRHEEAKAQFEQRAGEYARIVKNINTKQPVERTGGAQAATQTIAAAEDTALAELKEFFNRWPAKRKPGVRDAKKLPWSTPKPGERAPAETQTAWFQNLYGQQKVQLAQSGSTSTIGPLQFTYPPEAGQAPTEADMAESDEVQLTPALRAKAQELGNNPLAIYNWVQANIEWTPTAGAIQSAQDTFDKKRGNATDTATLLIALLRAANVPARYQWGTLDIPAAKVMNWVGGATVPEAALQILSQGGVAARGASGGGRIATIRMEHVWVQAYVNWAPGRASRNATATQHPNPNARLNAWVPLDASFKQYSYPAAVSIVQSVPLNTTALLAAATQGATVNEAEGWVKNLNQAAVVSELANYQSQLKTYIDSMPAGASSTVGDVIGKKIIPQQAQTLMAGTLQNAVVAQGAQLAAVPASLQHKFTYRLYASDTDQANDSPMLTFTEKTSKLVGKRLTLSYVPATQADADVIASYLPQPHADGSPIQPSELPTSLPGYLIRLRAQINLDGQVVAQANKALPMGTDLYSTGGFTQLIDATKWDLATEETNVIGNVTAIGISATGVSANQLNAAKIAIQAEQAQPLPRSLELVDTASNERIAGDLLSAAIWSWYASAALHNNLSRRAAGVLEFPSLSYGLIHAIVSPAVSWGVIRKVTFPGVGFDISHERNLGISQRGDQSQWINYMRLRGQFMSTLEQSILEGVFDDPTQCDPKRSPLATSAREKCPSGISAIGIIGISASAGQKIFTLTPEIYMANEAIVDQQLFAHSEATRDRVRQSLAAGYEVGIHEAPITLDGWSGSALVVVDASSGSAGYLIEGGANGGFRQFAGAVLQNPSLLRTPCGESFVEDAINKFVATNDTIPGLTLPVGATLLTAGVVAKDIGGYTFFQFVQLSMRNPHFLYGNATVLGLSAIVNNLLMSLAFEIGLLVGSGISASICRKD